MLVLRKTNKNLSLNKSHYMRIECLNFFAEQRISLAKFSRRARSHLRHISIRASAHPRGAFFCYIRKFEELSYIAKKDDYKNWNGFIIILFPSYSSIKSFSVNTLFLLPLKRFPSFFLLCLIIALSISCST